MYYCISKDIAYANVIIHHPNANSDISHSFFHKILIFKQMNCKTNRCRFLPFNSDAYILSIRIIYTFVMVSRFRISNLPPVSAMHLRSATYIHSIFTNSLRHFFLLCFFFLLSLSFESAINGIFNKIKQTNNLLLDFFYSFN